MKNEKETTGQNKGQPQIQSGKYSDVMEMTL